MRGKGLRGRFFRRPLITDCFALDSDPLVIPHDQLAVERGCAKQKGVYRKKRGRVTYAYGGNW